MDAIASYIDHMFRSLPQRGEVLRAKRDLLQMSEDRYEELRAQGASENAAVGQVIAQFGNLDEVADELGIRAEVDGLVADDALPMSDEDAERYLALTSRASLLISLGVAAILLGLAGLVLVTGSSEGDGDLPDALGLVSLFAGVIVAIPLFLLGGLPLGRYRRYEDRALALSPSATAFYKSQRERETPWFVAGISVGVGLILLAVAAMALIDALVPGVAESDDAAGVPGLMIAIALAVAILIRTGMRRGALDKLASEGDYDPATRNGRSHRLIGAIAGPYWLLATAIFLAWSFIGDAWDRSWIIWPIAGVLFGFAAATISGIGGLSRARE